MVMMITAMMTFPLQKEPEEKPKADHGEEATEDDSSHDAPAVPSSWLSSWSTEGQRPLPLTERSPDKPSFFPTAIVSQVNRQVNCLVQSLPE